MTWTAFVADDNAPARILLWAALGVMLCVLMSCLVAGLIIGEMG